MKILVALKRVPDPDAAPQYGEGIEPATMTMSPFDAAALAEAVRLRDCGLASELIAVTCGPGDCRDILRAALVAGADRAILVETRLFLQPLAVARLLKCIALEEAVDLILMGRQASDDAAAQTGPMLAAMLGWPQATSVSELRIAGSTVRAKRETGGGAETLALDLPAVATADLSLGCLAQRADGPQRTQLEVRPADALRVDLEPRLQILRREAAPSGRYRARVRDVEELLRCLEEVGALDRGKDMS